VLRRNTIYAIFILHIHGSPKTPYSRAEVAVLASNVRGVEDSSAFRMAVGGILWHDVVWWPSDSSCGGINTVCLAVGCKLSLVSSASPAFPCEWLSLPDGFVLHQVCKATVALAP